MIYEKDGGLACSGSRHETDNCAKAICPVDCRWGAWTQWNSCGATCGGGDSLRQRFAVLVESFGGTACSGQTLERRRCNKQDCPVDCVWKGWGEWSQCTK